MSNRGVGKGDAGGAEQEFHLLASVGAQSAVKGAEAAHPLAVAVLEEHLRPLLQKAKGGGSPRNTETEYQAFLTKEATGQHKNLRECSGFSSFAFVFLGYHTPLYFILKKYATTGDGLLTAIVITEELCDKKEPLSKLVEDVYLYPQYTENLRVKDKNEVLADEEVKKTVDIVKEKIGDQGRALVRASGTEPLIRVMIESPTEELCKEYARCIIEKIIERGYSIE
jgi:hypothetical protein